MVPPSLVLVALLAPSPAPTDPAEGPPRLSAPWLGLQRGHSERLDLRPLPGGGFEYEDAEGGFVATIAADGRVHFEGRRQTDLRGTHHTASAWFDGFVDALQRPPGRRDRPDLDSTIDRDDVSGRAGAAMETMWFGPYGPPPILVSLGGKLPQTRGPSDKAKRDFLAKTEAMRDTMALHFRQRQLEVAARRVSADVIAIWRDTTVPLSIRKRRVFELWADAENPRESNGPLQEALAEGRAELRRRIEAAIRMIAPEHSDDAFSRAELDELNAGRTGPRRFEPYRGASPGRDGPPRQRRAEPARTGSNAPAGPIPR